MALGSIWVDLKRVMRLARQVINAELELLNLSGVEGDILYHLLTSSERLRQEQLAERLDIGKTSISRAIDSLESKGFVIREAQPGDRRAHNLTLTEKAMEMKNTIEGIFNTLYQSASKGISGEEMAGVEFLLSRVAANLQSLGGR